MMAWKRLDSVCVGVGVGVEEVGIEDVAGRHLKFRGPSATRLSYRVLLTVISHKNILQFCFVLFLLFQHGLLGMEI